jgi:hypothetical protein
LTGPSVLKLQSKLNFAGKFPFATPSKAWLPRNIGQLSARTDSAKKQMATAQPYAWLLTFKCIRVKRVSIQAIYRALAQYPPPRPIAQIKILTRINLGRGQKRW